MVSSLRALNLQLSARLLAAKWPRDSRGFELYIQASAAAFGTFSSGGRGKLITRASSRDEDSVDSLVESGEDRRTDPS